MVMAIWGGKEELQIDAVVAAVLLTLAHTHLMTIDFAMKADRCTYIHIYSCSEYSLL